MSLEKLYFLRFYDSLYGKCIVHRPFKKILLKSIPIVKRILPRFRSKVKFSVARIDL